MLAEFNVELETVQPQKGRNLVVLTLDEPITIPGGQHLFMAVEMVLGTGDQRLRLDTCVSDPGVEYDYWSNAAATPYAWVEMQSPSAAHTGDLLFWAYGRPG